ncbi:hypothetical protein OGATHE_000239 [Ogataea polymorpha]|uniref:Uncharacterized protein n=1 Tax=Ogataea polymorpha TaxID=460523 RepID=A0A9P8PWS9_9ASCO|nr:hypothetical protein OGATHE_000239 [Ogataea polymorpha]
MYIKFGAFIFGFSFVRSPLRSLELSSVVFEFEYESSRSNPSSGERILYSFKYSPTWKMIKNGLLMIFALEKISFTISTNTIVITFSGLIITCSSSESESDILDGRDNQLNRRIISNRHTFRNSSQYCDPMELSRIRSDEASVASMIDAIRARKLSSSTLCKPSIVVRGSCGSENACSSPAALGDAAAVPVGVSTTSAEMEVTFGDFECGSSLIADTDIRESFSLNKALASPIIKGHSLGSSISSSSSSSLEKFKAPSEESSV